jgi:amidophosphoribosyltransferase
VGGYFGVASKENCVYDVFFGTDYHSHLGTRRGGMVIYDADRGFQRAIHNIENSPFRTKFESDTVEFTGNLGIGCISDMEPQPVLIRSSLGTFAVSTVSRINNIEELASIVLSGGSGHFFELSGGKINPTEVVATLIARKGDIVEGIKYVQGLVDGSLGIMVLTPDCIYAARDRYGRTPMMIGHKEGAFCASFESFAYYNIGYADHYELGPGEIVKMTPDGIETVAKAGDEMRICAFLWTYFGYPTSSYEGVNVEKMRYQDGANLAKGETETVDHVSGVPDSGTAHAIGFSTASGMPFARPLIKYTPTWPRSFMPQNQSMRDLIARMKLVPIEDLIKGQRMLIVDDSVVRGTQMRDTVGYLYNSGAKAVHIRPACPPLVFGCKYLNFSRSVSIEDLIARRVIKEREGTAEPSAQKLAPYLDPDSRPYGEMQKRICEMIGVDTLRYQRLDGLIDAIGIPKCKICTYCWSGCE